MLRTLSFCAALVCYASAMAQAASTITVGNHFLQPNTNGGPLNSFPIIISGNDTNIQGLTLSVQVGDGGPHGGGFVLGPGVSTGLAPGAGTGPFAISNYPGWGGSGYMFATNNTGITDTNNPVGGTLDFDYFGPQLLIQGTSTLGASVVSSVGGVTLVTLSFDTTGFTTGTWNLLLFGGNGGDTTIGLQTGAANLTVINGTITIVPEPSSIALAGLGLVCLWVWRRKR